MTGRVDVAWGSHGVDALAPTCDALVIVDVLSFTTTVDIAVARGARIYPYPWRDPSLAEYAHANAARAPARDAFNLRPASVVSIPPGTRLVLPSPNGSALSFRARDRGCEVVAGSLRNAPAVARWINASCGPGATVGIIAAGERWPDGSIRFALEDWIGAGAIAAALDAESSEEARAAAAAFEVALADRFDGLRATASALEKADRGESADVDLAFRYDVSGAVPRLDDTAFVPLGM